MNKDNYHAPTKGYPCFQYLSIFPPNMFSHLIPREDTGKIQHLINISTSAEDREAYVAKHI